ncbi:MAG: arginyl-tRNA synthetase [Pseudohongiellaceae bacterium]|jgi:arginyl-tRNA synthetase
MQTFVRPFAEKIAAIIDLPVDEVAALINSPPRADMGQLAFPCFQLAKSRREAPPKIAAAIAEQLQLDPDDGSGLLSVSAAGPYVNAFLDGAVVAAKVLPAALDQGSAFGGLDMGKGEVVTVDFSSPNIAKSFGIHHLRSTVIGHALVGMLSAAGYKPVGINHLGDWGTQFGQLLAIWNDEGDETRLSAEGIDYLLSLYVEFNRRKDADPSLQERARACFQQLEQGDAESRRLWKLFRDTSMAEFERVYKRLGIHFDDTRGESFYEDLMASILAELEEKQLLSESQDATVVDLEPYDLGVALVRKSDGSTLYLTRDLASADFRRSEYGFVRSLYVVGGAQSLHFAQMIKVLELLGRDWADAIEHVPFGLMRFADRKMSTRKGDIIRLSDVLDKAVAMARETMESGAREKGRTLPDDIDEVAHRIGVGAVVFNDLKNRRQRDVIFDWDVVLSFEGETGPYLQYTAARIASMIDKHDAAPRSDADWTLVSGPGELDLALALDGLSRSLQRGIAECEPSLVSDQLLQIAARFSTLYSNRNWKVLTEDAELSAARIALAAAVRQALVNGLGWLGIPVPDRM